MQAYDPLTAAAMNGHASAARQSSQGQSHPLSSPPAELPFHPDDDDGWTPPALPGEERFARPSRSSPFAGAAARNRSSATSAASKAPLLDPLLHDPKASRTSSATQGSTRLAAADQASGRDRFRRDGRPVEEGRGAGSMHSRRTEQGLPADALSNAVARSNRPFGASLGGESLTLSAVHSLHLHTYYTPTFCDACSQLLVGILQQGLRCEVCQMNLHPECRSTPCSSEHRCRPSEPVRISAGVDGSRLDNMLRLRAGNPARAGTFGGGAGAVGKAAGAGAPPKDPLNSEWHQILIRDKQLWVPDSLAAMCMVCARPFNMVFRRHHCRRCGACMCGSCSHMTVSDKVLSVNQMTGDVIRISSNATVRCCTLCTHILDYQLAQALQRKGWGTRHGSAAAANAAAAASSSSATVTGPRRASPPVAFSATEAFDGGNFAPPSSSRGDDYPASSDFVRGSNRGYAEQASASRNEFSGDVRQSGGYSDDDFGSNHGNGYGDPLSAVDQRRHQQPKPQTPPVLKAQFGGPPAGTEVPSWLGNSSLATRSAAGGIRKGNEVDDEKREVSVSSRDGNRGTFADVHATDWSASGSVV